MGSTQWHRCRHIFDPFLFLCRHLLHQIKLNQDAQKPEGLAKNFVLLREINMNIDKVGGGRAGPPRPSAVAPCMAPADAALPGAAQVMGLYNAISDDFATFMQHTRPNSASGGHLGSDDADQPAGREAAS